MHPGRSLKRCVAAAALLVPVCLQGADLSIVGAHGFSGGEEQDTHGVSALGVSIGAPFGGRHRVQCDYLFHADHLREPIRHHFLTGSYVVQGTAGRTRPFFQVGAGILRENARYFGRAANDFAVLFGAGATIDMGRSFYLRPHVRVYGHAGPTLSILPALGAGWRF